MRFTIFIIFLLVNSVCFGQYEFDYTPLNTKDDDFAEATKRSVSERLEFDLKQIESEYKKQIKEYFNNRTEWLLEHIEEGNYIYDDSFTTYVENVLERILESNPQIKRKPDRILIDRNTSPNALCSGEGTLVVNLGLLRRIENESQLAFVIAHELAHYVQDHVNRNIESKVEQLYGYETNKKIKNIRREGTSKTLKALDLLKGIMYTGVKYSREYETEADSLAVIYLANTPYDTKASISLLQILDSADFPKYKYIPILDSVFNFEDYPFKKDWLVEEEQFFHNSSNSSFIFNLDSLKTHPDIQIRIDYLKEIMPDNSAGQLNIQSSETLKWINTTSDFEVIESAYFLEDYDRCLFLTLQGLRVYKDHPYLHSMIGKLFIELYKARRDHAYGKYVPSYSREFNKGLKEINTFLHNLRLNEIGTIGILYMNSKNNFDTKNQDHYYLLWKLSVLTQDEKLKAQLENAYNQNFPNGKYIELINNSN